ncbi:MAG: acyl-CoA/acyl-ACP dehydrogenase [Caldisphaeraceae archaeon]|nr:acyl-CoA/acyl-ACP dehydrogenase [Caldisphaeraceae archaeon]MEB3692130.1 acyl-CoA/acyl-ACP dehydrogenase [Caldisphaeraceae archaeon]MEB3797913.1 acyl-CoA/acyl-ACP dehydrogenase [Caldisphaeraceae archaeon]
MRNLDFGLSPDEKLFKDSVNEFLSKTLNPVWTNIDSEKRIPTEIINKMGEQGLFAIPVPEEYGGQGGNFLLASIAVEEVAYNDPAVATAVFTLLNNSWPFILYLYGNEETKQEILPLVGKGRGFFGIASTESIGGSDVAGERTSARKEGGLYVINGEKIYISGVRESLEQLDLGSWYLIARTGKPEDKHRGLTGFAFIGNKNGRKAENFEYSILNTIGRHAISTGLLRFNNTPIEQKYVIGEENKGFYLAMQGFSLARILVSAANIGAAKWALEQAVRFSRERRMFDDRPIASYQGVSFPIAEVAAKLESARLLVYKAAQLADKIYIKKEAGYRPHDLNYWASIAKIMAVETAFNSAEVAMKTYGAYSYTEEADLFRNMLGVLSYYVGAEGSQNIMRYIVARELIGREYVKA